MKSNIQLILVMIFISFSGCGEKTEVPEKKSEPVNPPVTTIEVEDISDYDHGKIYLMRNEIFARQGYSFKSSWLKEYFGQAPWYVDKGLSLQ